MTLYGCHNRPPYIANLKVQDGYWDDSLQRIPKLTSAPFRMNPDCQYTLSHLGQKDPQCTGCKHNSSHLSKSAGHHSSECR